MDLVFGDVRHFITDDIFERYDRIGVHGPFTLYRNTPEVNKLYRQIGDIKRIFTEQHPFGFDEWGRDCGTSHYWLGSLRNKVWSDEVFDNLAPYHYSFVSSAVRNSTADIRNLMFCYDRGKLYRYGTVSGRIDKHEALYVYLQKRPIAVKTAVSSRFSIVPPGCFIPFVDDVTSAYLKWHVRDSDFWAYYVRARNKLNRWTGIGRSSNMVLLHEDDQNTGRYKKIFYKRLWSRLISKT